VLHDTGELTVADNIDGCVDGSITKGVQIGFAMEPFNNK
jgi:hypothetical protein